MLSRKTGNQPKFPKNYAPEDVLFCFVSFYAVFKISYSHVSFAFRKRLLIGHLFDDVIKHIARA